MTASRADGDEASAAVDAAAAVATDAEERVRLIMKDGRDVPVDKRPEKDVPEWFDETLFVRGQKYFYDNFYAMMVSKLIGLILVLSIPTILDVLIHSNRSSEPYTAFRRYLDTIRHMLRWYKHDVKNLKSKSQKSVTIVNGLHCAASRTSQKSGLGLRITQKDMVLTQFGFIGLTLLKKKELAIRGTEEDEISMVHFWRTMGHFLGIQDKYNLCRGSLEEVRAVCDVILRDVYGPALRAPPKGFDHMVAAMIEGMKPVSPMLDVDAFVSFVYKMCGVTGMSERMKTRYSRCMYFLQTYTHDVLLVRPWLAAVFRPLLNYNMIFSVWLNITFPFGAALRFGAKAFARVPLDQHQPSSIRVENFT